MTIGGLNVNAIAVDLMDVLDRIATALERIADALEEPGEDEEDGP